MSTAPAPAAVFLSYASQDAEAARRLAEALRAAGVEVWFDQNELQGGDAWDAKIRRQIAECALFVPVISAATQARLEGYFRLEWKLAAQRTHTMAEEKAFLLPVVIDDTRDSEAKVPTEFKAVQWTRLPGGENAEKFCARVAKLLGATATTETVSAPPSEGPGSAPVPGAAARWRSWRRPFLIGLALGGVALVAALGVWAPWRSAAPPAAPVSATVAAVSPPAPPPEAPLGEGKKSVAVLPFANLSGDKDQEYFSDGLTEEILNALARERDLRVPGRTSSFSFKGKNASAAEIARALGVTQLVEGSVQRAGTRVRIRVALTRASDGFSEELGTFTEELTDIFALQDKVARAVVAKLTRRTATATGTVVLTSNSAAYDAYLRGRDLQTKSASLTRQAATHFEEAVRLDPQFTLAWARLAEARFRDYSAGSDRSPTLVAASLEAAERALAISPDLVEGLAIRAGIRGAMGQREAAERDRERILDLAPGSFSALLVRGERALRAKNWHQAAEIYIQMLALEPKDGDWLNVAAIRFRQFGDARTADRLFATALDVQGEAGVAALSNRVFMRRQWRGPEEALQVLRLGFRKHPSLKGELMGLEASLLGLLGRKPELERLLENADISTPVVWRGGDATVSNRTRLMWALTAEQPGAAKALAEQLRRSAREELAAGNRAPLVYEIMAACEIALGNREAAYEALASYRTVLPSSVERPDSFTTSVGRVLPLYGRLGDIEAVLDLHESATRGGLRIQAALRFDSSFDPIRADPRFQALMADEAAWAEAQGKPDDQP